LSGDILAVCDEDTIPDNNAGQELTVDPAIILFRFPFFNFARFIAGQSHYQQSSKDFYESLFQANSHASSRFCEP
jgi:hypothetical protein